MTVDRLGFDSNVLGADGERQNDFVVSLEPNVNIWVPIARRGLISGALKNGLAYYKNHPEQRSLDPGFSVKGEWSLGRFTPFILRALDQARRRPNAEIEVRVPLTSVDTQFGTAYRMPRFGFELSRYRTTYTYGADAKYRGIALNTELNRREQGARFRVDHQLTSMTSMYLAVENRKDEFTASPLKNSDGVRTVVGAEFGRRALVFGEASIGLRTMSMKGASVPSYRGLVAGMTLTHQLRGASALKFEWQRDVNHSFLLEHPYYTSNVVAGEMRQQLFGAYDAIVGLRRQLSVYVRTPADTFDPHVVTKMLSLDLGRRLTHSARIGAVLTRTWLKSDLPTFAGFSGLRFGMSLSTSF